MASFSIEASRDKVIDFMYPIGFKSYAVVFFTNHTTDPATFMFTSLHYSVWLAYLGSCITVVVMTVVFAKVINKYIKNDMVINTPRKVVVWNGIRMMLRVGKKLRYTYLVSNNF